MVKIWSIFTFSWTKFTLIRLGQLNWKLYICYPWKIDKTVGVCLKLLTWFVFEIWDTQKSGIFKSFIRLKIIHDRNALLITSKIWWWVAIHNNIHLLIYIYIYICIWVTKELRSCWAWMVSCFKWLFWSWIALKQILLLYKIFKEFRVVYFSFELTRITYRIKNHP